MTDEIRRINKRDDLVALANELGVRPDWHEPDEQEVTAAVRGTSFDNCGNWGSAEVRRIGDLRRRGHRAGVTSMEIFITLYKDGEPVGEVNLATLFAFATGYEGR